MKIIITLSLLAIALTVNILAQAPNKMSYQAIIRNASNALITDKTVGIRISILQSSVNGNAVFIETHTPKTNGNGLATIEIGGGTAENGTFAGIDWSKGPYFIKTETDPTGGSSYDIVGVSQLLSVPYSLQAASLSPIATGVVRNLNGKGGNIVLKGAGGTSISSNGDTINISSSGGAGGTGIQGVQNTDGIVRINNPNGPIATLNINDGSIPIEKLAASVIPTSLPPNGAAGGDLGGTYPNPSVVRLQGRPFANTLPTLGQSIAWNGTQWAPSTVSSGWSLTGNAAINPLTNYLGTSDSIPLIIKTFNSERMRISGVGNVGIGTINPIDKFQIGDYTVGSNLYSSIKTVGGNQYKSGIKLRHFSDAWGWTLVSDEVATKFNIIRHLDDTTGSVAMSIDGFNGNVGIGTTTPAAKLEVNDGNITIRNTSADAILLIDNPTNTKEARLELTKWGGLGSGSVGFYPGNGDLHLRSTATGANLVFDVASTEKMRVTPSGNVGIGTTTPATKLEVVGAVKLSGGSISMCSTADNSSGNIGIGAGPYNATKLWVESNQQDGVVISAPNSQSGLYVNGTAIKSGGSNWVVASDFRLKENVQQYNDGLALLNKINPIKFHYTESSGFNKDIEYIGVLAQELKVIAPYMVSTFTNKADNKEYLSVDNNAMTYMLINAIKEQQQEIDNLRIETLKTRTQQLELEGLRLEVEKVKEQMQALEAAVRISTATTGK